MVTRRSYHTPEDEAGHKVEKPRLRIPVIPALLGALGLLNVASAVFALIEY
jgi:hypothetical protein